jgi:hypothetical protein
MGTNLQRNAILGPYFCLFNSYEFIHATADIPMNRPSSLSTVLLASVVFYLTMQFAESADPPQEMKSIGGHWFVKVSERPVYYYRDKDQFVDLFSYHSKDSNRDGIDNLKLSHDDHFLIIDSQGYPNHPTAIFPNSNNPNTIRVQKFTFKIPLVPKLSDEITRLPMGPIGTAMNGVVFFNPFEIGGMNAVEGYSEEWLDSCCGHPQQTGIYHYHKYPTCVRSPFKDDGKQHSPMVGFAFDGFPIFGPYESAGELAMHLEGANSLDACNGHQDTERGYHYHVTQGRFPYIIGGYRGIVEESNNPGFRRSRIGAIENRQYEGDSRLDKVIVAIQPETASRGAKHTLQIELDPSQAKRTPVPDSAPSWVQVGPYEAIVINRKGRIISVEIAIPIDAPVGVLMDCHLEFDSSPKTGGPMVYKKNDVFQVVE